MASRLKTTGFTRFLLMIIIVVPLAYIGAAYYNGEDPIANIKALFGDKASVKKEQTEKPNTAEVPDTYDARKELEACKRENDLLNKRIADLEALLEQKK
jgi:cell division protein FtsB